MKYLVYKRKQLFREPEVYVVEATSFKVTRCSIIFKKGFKKAALFNTEEVEQITPEKEGESE